MAETNNDRVTKLPRGGLRIETKDGPVQVGIPPETIKDSMNLGIPIPTHYIVPKIRFDRRSGINVAESEFPAYFNFFVLRKKVNLITTPDGERRIRRVFQETLFGPKHIDIRSEFADSVPESVRPDLEKECAYFRKNPFEPGQLMEVDTLLDFTHFDDDGIATLPNGTQVKIVEDEYSFIEDGQEIARVNGRVQLPVLPREEIKVTFKPPMFGVTILGFSHGFDPKGKTTGFVIWLNRRGLMVDPPINSGYLLRQNGIPSRLIDAVILTHCHADHDAGTFQKILEESKIVVYATPTVLGSFLRKYSALAGLDEDFLRRLFTFRPIRLGEPIRHKGGELRFFYSLHSIPAIGFEAYFGGKSIVFSGDTLNDPGRVQQMFEEGVLSAGRRDFLLNFPWHHSVVLHEAGVPPLHTPISTLEALPDDIKERLYCVHIAEKDMPDDKGLKLARAGVENTIRVNVDKPTHADAIEILDLIGSIDFFRNFDIAKAREVLQICRRRKYEEGATIIAEGAVGDRFFVITGGVARVETKEGSKHYTTGDYFGETSLVTGRRRNATIVAMTAVEVIEFDRYDFLYLLRGTDVMSRMRHLAEMRRQRSWHVLGANKVLASLSSAQKTQLQALVRKREVKKGEVLWQKGQMATEAVIIDEGTLEIELPDGEDEDEDAELTPFGQGAFIGEINSLIEGIPLTTSVKAIEDSTIFSLSRSHIIEFFEHNPGVQLAFLNTRFVE